MTPQSQLQNQDLSPWCLSFGKRALDVTVAAVILLLAGSLMLLIAITVRATSVGPALFRQERLGLYGRRFELLKFRTMRLEHSFSAMKLTPSGDARITRIGKWLRDWKLDELPQLINVLKGDMSLVGPRPDVEEFWRLASETDRRALALKPGVTGAASLSFIHEGEMLARFPQTQLLNCYVREVLPRKVQLDLAYAAQASLWSDLNILLRTCVGVFRPAYPVASETAQNNESLSRQ